MTPEFFTDTLTELAAKEKEIVAALKSVLGIYAVVKLVEPKIHRPQRGQGRPCHRPQKSLSELRR